MKRLLFFLLSAFALFCTAGEVELTILQSTDLHGSPSVAKFAKWIAEERQEDPNLLLVDCGDLCNGTFETYCDGGASMISYLNLCKYDVFVPGNHEFRIGNKNFKRNLNAFTSGSVLAANLKFDKKERKPIRPIRPWKMFQRKGLKIAVIGMTSHFCDKWLSFALYDGIRILSPVDTLKEIMPEIRKAKPDFIMVVAHSDLDQPVETVTGNDTWIPARELYSQYPDIQLFLAGHTHRQQPASEFAPGQWVVQPKSNGESMAKIRVTCDSEKHCVVNVTAEFVNADEMVPLPDSEMPEAWVANNKAAALARKQPVLDLPPDMVYSHETKSGGMKPELVPEIIRRATGADAAIIGKKVHVKPSTPTPSKKLFCDLPDTGLTILTLTPEQLKVVLEEQGDLQGRSSGIDPENLPTEPIRVVFDDYDVTGCDGQRMKLRAIALSGVPQEHLKLTIRSCIRSYLLRTYPAK